MVRAEDSGFVRQQPEDAVLEDVFSDISVNGRYYVVEDIDGFVLVNGSRKGDSSFLSTRKR